jgi:hypothetical protein
MNTCSSHSPTLTCGCTAWNAMSSPVPTISRATSQIPKTWNTSAYSGHIRLALAQTKRTVWLQRNRGPSLSR